MNEAEIQRVLSQSTDIVLMQTSDPFVYREMLNVSERVNILFCRKWSMRYESYIGMKKGVVPWQATYNRIFMLQELIDRGFSGWAIFIDADALISDFNYDIRAYLDANSQYCIIGAEGGEADWNINAGVVFINLGLAEGKRLVSDWRHRLSDLPEAYFSSSTAKWDEYPNDQHLLHDVIQGDENIRRLVKKEPKGMFNYDGSVIKQAIRASFNSLDDRTAWLKAHADKLIEEEEALA